MPDLVFKVIGVEAASHGLTPLLRFNLEVENQPESEKIHTVMLQAQIQLQCPQRTYKGAEKERLTELFGAPERWGQTLRNRLWGLSSSVVRGFSDRTEATLSMPCTFDLNVAATKYFYALEGGEVPLLFLFSGSIFYQAEGGRLQVQQISWDKECAYRMPVEVWKKMMEQHFPNSAWLMLDREVYDQLYAYKRSTAAKSWDEAINSLLNAQAKEEVAS